MPTKPKSRSRRQDRKRVSSEKHEISYAGRKFGKNGGTAVRKAKAKLGRTTSRSKVMTAAAALTQVRSRARRLLAAIERKTAA